MEKLGVPGHCSRAIRAALLAGLLCAFGAPGVPAQQVELISRTHPSQIADTGSGPSTVASMSADGRYVVFLGDGANLVPGYVDGPYTTQVYLFDRITGTRTLVSRAAGTTATEGAGQASSAVISADGAFVAFASTANNLVVGQVDAIATTDVFLWERATGAMTLVSHLPGLPVTTSSSSAYEPAISADGAWIAIRADANNLVPGQTDSNGASDVFLYERAANTLTLVSHQPGLPTSTGSGFSAGPSISADGAFVAYYGRGNNLIPGQIDPTSSQDVFLFDRATGTNVLVSHQAASIFTAANNDSDGPRMSANGAYVAFQSNATNLVAGQSDTNFTGDLFLYERATGTSGLVSHSSVSLTTTSSSFSSAPAVSANGQFVAYASSSTNLVSGQVDGGFTDVFLYNRVTATSILVSRRPGLPTTTTGTGDSDQAAISADGAWVSFRSGATNLVVGQVDVAFGPTDVFRFEAATANVTLVSRQAGTATTAGNLGSLTPVLGTDGTFVAYTSFATNLENGVADLNGTSDVFLFGSASNTTVSRRDPSLPALSGNQESASSFDRAIALDAQGRFAAFVSRATNLVPGQVDTNNVNDVFLFDHLTGSIRLLSRAAGTAATAGGQVSDRPAISADGNWVAFVSNASNLVTGQNDVNSGGGDVFLYDVVGNTLVLVSHAAGSATTTGSSYCIDVALSADGSWIAFVGASNNHVAGQTDPLSTTDVFFYSRATGTISLASPAAGSPTTAANNSSDGVRLSADGRYVAFRSDATNLVAGQVDSNAQSDVFLFDRVSGTSTLVSHTPGSATTTGNGGSGGLSSFPAVSMSGDGGFVAFHGAATNLVAGVTDGNSSNDVFLFDRAAGTVRLVSHQAGVPTTAAGSTSASPSMSADGNWVAYLSQANNLVAAQVDLVGTDAFLYSRVTDTSVLASRQAGTTTTAVGGNCADAVVSANGFVVAFQSEAGNLVPGEVDPNASAADVYVFLPATGTVLLASRALGTTNRTGSARSDNPVLSDDGGWVAFSSLARNLVPGDFNDALSDGFLFGPMPLTDLAVTKDDALATVAPGETVTYAIQVTNNGPATVTSLTLTDVVPPEIPAPAFAPSAGSYDSGSGAWTGLNLGPGQTVTLTLTGTISLSATGSLTNTATVAPPAGVTDGDSSNDSATDVDTLVPRADVSVTKVDSPDPITVGGVLTYDLLAANAGPSNATGVTLTDVLPAGLAFASVTPPCTYTAATRTVSCALGTLGPAGSVPLTITAVVGASGSIVNTAGVTHGEADPDPINDQASATTTVGVPGDAVRFFTVRSTSGQNLLEWQNPVGAFANVIVHRTIAAPECGWETVAGTPATLVHSRPFASGALQSHPDTGLLDGTTYCYSIFVNTAGASYSAGRFNSGRPFVTSGPVKWAFSIGTAALAPPGNGVGVVHTAAMDNSVHSMTKGDGAAGGSWPAGWTPLLLSGPSQGRPTGVPFAVGTATRVLFLGSQGDGHVYAVNADTGGQEWMTASPVGERVQAGLSGMFQMFGGTQDHLYVGTRNTLPATSGLSVRDAQTGAPIWAYSGDGTNGLVGPVHGQPAVDYAAQRLYFASRAYDGGANNRTVWCLDLVAQNACWASAHGDVDGGVTLRGGRLYVGTSAGTVRAIDAASGALVWEFTPSPLDGPVRGFVFADSASDDLYFATGSRVFALSDDGSGPGYSENWPGGVAFTSPSPSVFFSDLVYAGGGGSLSRLRRTDGGLQDAFVLGDGSAQVGAPTLDTTNGFAYVGTDAGIIYAIRLP